MKNQNTKMKKIMHEEAMKRMELMGVKKEHMLNFAETGLPTIVKVTAPDGDVPGKVWPVTPSEMVVEMVRKIEEEKQILVYYIICDEGLWPDGATFPRYSMLHVDQYESDYPLVKEEYIGRCETVPAYVYNGEEDFIELAEVAYHNVSGLLVQLS